MGLYSLAFFADDSRTMATEQQWLAGAPDPVPSIGLSLASDSLAYAGHAAKARELTKRSIDSAIRADSKETGAVSQAIAAQWEAVFGNAAEAKQQAAGTLSSFPTVRTSKSKPRWHLPWRAIWCEPNRWPKTLTNVTRSIHRCSFYGAGDSGTTST